MKKQSLIKCSEFVKRQTPDSGYSHYNGSWEELEDLVEGVFSCNPKQVRPGYKDGVVLVDLIHTANRFSSAIVELNDQSKLTANFAPRREGEASFLRVSARAKKQTAKYASVVLYRADVLAEDNDRSGDAEWEIVCIKARTSEQEEPMDPYTMARNFLHLAGGTKGDFTAEQFAESIVYWNNHCMTTNQTPWWKRAWNWFRTSLQDAGRHFWDNLPYLK